MTIYDLYDFIKTYIDKKMTGATDTLKKVMEDNKVLAVGSNIENVKTVGTNIDSVNITAGSIDNVNTVAEDKDNINSVANNKSNIDIVASVNADVTTVSADIESIKTNASNIEDIKTNATNISDINTTASDLNLTNSNIKTVAASIENVNITGNNITDVNTFAKVYQGAKDSDPTSRNDGSSLQTGDLYFNTTDKVLKQYDGANWTITQQYSDLDILNKLKNVDGTGSGLDADLVRGANVFGNNPRNRIINGDFSVWQRGTSFTTSDNSLVYAADRFFTFAQNGVNVSKGDNSYIWSLSDDTNDFYYPIRYRFEGLHLYDLAKNGNKITISFEFKTTKIGTYTIALVHYDQTNTDNKESFIKEFEATTANTSEKIEVTFDLSELQYTLSNNENKEFELFLCAYNNYTGAQGNIGYNDGLKVTTAKATQLTSSDTLEFKELQLEKGNIATEFESVPFDIQLQRCLRYYEKGTYRYRFFSTDSGQYISQWVNFTALKRVLPSIITTVTSANYAEMSNDNLQVKLNGFKPGPISTTGAVNTGWMYFDWTADAEL